MGVFDGTNMRPAPPQPIGAQTDIVEAIDTYSTPASLSQFTKNTVQKATQALQNRLTQAGRRTVTTQTGSRYYEMPANLVGLYQPADGPLILGDYITTRDKNFKRGAIMSAVINTLEAADYQQATAHADNNVSLPIQSVINFDTTLNRIDLVVVFNHNNVFLPDPIPGVRSLKANALNTYQYIIEKIKDAPKGNVNAVACLKGFSVILWDIYAQNNKWFATNAKAKEQVLKEIKQLADAAEYHDPSLAKQMRSQAASPSSFASYAKWSLYAISTVGAAVGVGFVALKIANFLKPSGPTYQPLPPL